MSFGWLHPVERTLERCRERLTTCNCTCEQKRKRGWNGRPGVRYASKSNSASFTGKGRKEDVEVGVGFFLRCTNGRDLNLSILNSKVLIEKVGAVMHLVAMEE